MFVTPTPTVPPTVTPVSVLVAGYGVDAISVGDVAVVGVLLFGLGLLVVVLILLLLRRSM